MIGFKKINMHRSDDEWDARQRLISGWDAEAIKNATVLVIGAGAIGNETIKNLALLGLGHVIICDLDKVEMSNLTRTVLFSQDDIGKEKASLAMQKFLQMNLEPTATADALNGDIVYELGDGVFRRADIVLGCLDNAETRMYVNKICMRYDIPYIDAGIGSLGCTLQVMKGHSYGCYQCHAAAYKFEDRFRQSCDITKKKAEAQGKMATVQCTSAIVSGMQVQEALKVICNIKPEFGVELHFQGTANLFNKFKMGIDDNCWCHLLDARVNVMETQISASNSLRDFLTYTSSLGYTILEINDFEDHLRNFVTYAKCPGCGKNVKIFSPMFKVFSEDFYCTECKKKQVSNKFINVMDDISLSRYSLAETSDDILNMSLNHLGIPYFHVLPVTNPETRETAYFELKGDIERMMPAYAKKHQNNS